MDKKANRPDDEEGFELCPELEDELVEAMAEADRGETMEGWQLLRELKGKVDDRPLEIVAKQQTESRTWSAYSGSGWRSVLSMSKMYGSAESKPIARRNPPQNRDSRSTSNAVVLPGAASSE